MVSNRALFVHKHYLQYIPPIPPNQCQHLALSIIVSTMTNKAPVAVMSNPHTVRYTSQQAKLQAKENLSCEEWVQIIGAKDLPSQTAAFVGQIA